MSKKSTKTVRTATAPPVGSSALFGGGTIHPPRTMFLRVHCGEAKAGKLKYEMATHIAGMPIVESKQTGKWFTLTWQDIIEQAVRAGIDEPPNDKVSDGGGH